MDQGVSPAPNDTVPQAHYYANPRPEMMRYLPESATRLLDVGCGGGAFAAQAAQLLGCEAWGVEPVATVADQARQRLAHVVKAPFAAGLELPAAGFDAIVFNDSLEHMVDPWAALDYSRSLLAPGGCVVASIPNVRYIDNLKDLLLRGDWRYVDEGILDRTHLRFFTRKSIIETFEASGFDVQRIEGINPHPWRSWRLKLVRLAFGRHVEDMRWLQFAVVARPKTTA